jgi:hypothetical protein
MAFVHDIVKNRVADPNPDQHGSALISVPGTAFRSRRKNCTVNFEKRYIFPMKINTSY